jgi:hypothetical protein
MPHPSPVHPAPRQSLLLHAVRSRSEHGEVQLDGTPRQHQHPAWRSQVVYQPAEPAWWLPAAGAHFKPQQMQRVRELLPAEARRRCSIMEISRLSTGGASAWR